MKIRKDKYLSERGGTAKIIKVLCMKCGRQLLIYQKDGSGWLKRLYLNRIISPEKYSNLQKDPQIKGEKGLKKLICECGEIIGIPIKHKDGRLAFHLIRSKFKRANLNKQ